MQKRIVLMFSIFACSSPCCLAQRVELWSAYLDPERLPELASGEFTVGVIYGPSLYESFAEASVSSDSLGCFGCGVLLPTQPDIDWATEAMLYAIWNEQILDGAPAVGAVQWGRQFVQSPILPFPLEGPTLSFSAVNLLPGGDFSGIRAAALHTIPRDTGTVLFAVGDPDTVVKQAIAQIQIVPEPSTFLGTLITTLAVVGYRGKRRLVFTALSPR